MIPCRKSISRVGACCWALLLSAPDAAGGDRLLILPSVDAQAVAPSSCESSNEGNIRATFSKGWQQILLREQLITDLKSIRSELASQRTWWRGDPTSETSLTVAVVLRTIKTKTDLIFDLVETGATISPATRQAACTTSALKALTEKTVSVILPSLAPELGGGLSDGSLEDIGVKISKCISKNPGNLFFETVDILEKIMTLTENVGDTVQLTLEHDELKEEVKKQTVRLDLQIARYEESNRQAQDQLREMERALREAIRAHCENPAAVEELQRVMDQTRAGMAAVGTKHREVMKRVDLAREQRSSAMAQQMQDTQRMQQQRLMMLQQQEMRQQIQQATGEQRFSGTNPPAQQSLPRQEPQYHRRQCVNGLNPFGPGCNAVK